MISAKRTRADRFALGGTFMMEDSIRITVQTLRTNRNASSDDLLRLLIDRGIERPIAVQLVTLVPIAYGRVGLGGAGVKFSEKYLCMEQGSESYSEHRLDDLALWKEIVAFARQDFARGIDQEALLSVAGRSSEVDAVNKALHNGRELQSIVCSPPVFMWLEFRSASSKTGPKHWWEIWR